MEIYRPYDADALLDHLRRLKIAIIGYGSQGAAHALNLRDSGAHVVVGLHAESRTRATVERDGLPVMSTPDAVRDADIVMLLLPDELQPAVYEAEVEPHLKAGALVGFAHGFAYHFRKLTPRDDVGVFLVAPKGPGVLVRSRYLDGSGVVCLVAVGQDPGACARRTAQAYAAGLGAARIGLIDTTFGDEAETDLFGEQTVLCGGVSALIHAAFETLVEAGYPPELAYFECCHELKQVTDLIYTRGIAGMRGEISNTAEYGQLTRGWRVIGPDVRQAMRTILEEIRSGRFADEWMAEQASGLTRMRALAERDAAHPIEPVGERVRAQIFPPAGA